MNDEPTPGTEAAYRLARIWILRGSCEILFGLPPTPAALRAKAAIESMMIAIDELHAEKRQYNVG